MAQTTLDTEVLEIMQAYEICLSDAQDRTAILANDALRPRFFAAKTDACLRVRNADLSTIYSTAGLAATRHERAVIEVDIASMTEALLAGARADLCLTEAN